MNSKQAAKRMKELEDFTKLLRVQFGVNSWKSTSHGGETINEVANIYVEFKNGCKREFEDDNVPYICDGKLCIDCQKIKKIYDAILGADE